MEKTKDVQDANPVEVDMLFVIIGCLVKRLGGTVHIGIDEIEKLNGGFVTDANELGVFITMVDEMPEGAKVLVQ
jgi:hypothetical protein